MAGWSLALSTDRPLQADEPTIHFDRDIRPLLSDRCFKCHGPDAKLRAAGLRLDQREAVLGSADSGKPIVIPGNAAASELVRRITSTDPDERMPPANAQKSLSPTEINQLVRWVNAGAEYTAHWSFTPLQRPQTPVAPAATTTATAVNPIDAFVESAWAEHDLHGAALADRATLIRRVTLDLTGLPPTVAEVEAFVSAPADDAYEQLVDRLLASPHFGERMALDWLDASRFADTNGYHLDNGRDMTRWRAWVINAFNRNLPFDQFTVEQLAGDLLPEASDEQRLASGFHRNHMINFEGGAIPEEYLTAYIVDRVNTTATVWLGLTIGCAQCHDHKYDPISQREYYQLYAFFNGIDEKGLDGNRGNAAPLIQIPTAMQREQRLAILDQLASVEAAIRGPLSDVDAEQLTWEAAVAADQPTAIDNVPAELLSAAHRAVQVRTADQVAQLRHFFREHRAQHAQWQALRSERERLLAALKTLDAAVPTSMVMQELSQARETFVLQRGQYDQPGERVEANVPVALGALPDGMPHNRLGLAKWLVSKDHPLMARVVVNRYWQMLFGSGLVRTPEDFGSQGERPTHPPLLDWLASEFQHSTQPAFKDAPDWNVKALLKLIVMSRTYRQDSTVTAESLAKDADNRWLSRGARFRLPAEFIRDQALACSGLLVHQIGGPSVNPYQPAGLWQELSSRGDSSNWTAQVFVQDHGDLLYRRSMYTFWKRTCPPPQMSTFDAPDRETCTVRRARTNTPLQALILMNDPTYLEASRHLAQRILVAGGATDERLRLAFRTVTSRVPTVRELSVLQAGLTEQLERYRTQPELAKQLLQVGESPCDASIDPGELAAWTMLSSALLNLDEAVTRR